MAHLLPDNPFDFDCEPPVGEGSSSSGPSRPLPRELSVTELIMALQNHETREEAIAILAKHRNTCEDLAPLLWNTFGNIAVLLQELVAVYGLLSVPNFPDRASTRVCNALALLQSVGSHSATKKLFINAELPLYIYPLFETRIRGKTHEFVRISSLGVIGAIVKVADTDIIKYLLDTELYPRLLHCMDIGGEILRTIATFILQKILTNDIGLRYSCCLAERFYATSRVMEKMLSQIPQEPSERLVKFIVSCYLRLSEDARACDGFKCCLPMNIRSSHVLKLLNNDPIALGWLRQFIYNVETGHRLRPAPENLLKRMLNR